MAEDHGTSEAGQHPRSCSSTSSVREKRLVESPRRQQCPRIHCSLIVKEERIQLLPDCVRGFDVKGGKERTVLGKREDLLVLQRPAESLRNGAGFSRKT